MLVQVSNDSSKDTEVQRKYQKTMNLLETKLQKAGLVYLKYIGETKKVVNSNLEPTLEYVSKNDSQIDVIVFKVGPATGWDIPRANMLLQLRDVSSETLNIQTVGRIRRNPNSDLSRKSITDKYYLYSDYQMPTRHRETYRLQNWFKETRSVYGVIDKKVMFLKRTKDNTFLMLKASSLMNSLMISSKFKKRTMKI